MMGVLKSRRRVVAAVVAAGFVGAAGYFIARNLASSIDQLRDRSAADLTLLLPALGLMTASVVAFGFVWVAMLRWLQPGNHIDSRLLRFFLVSWPGRYVPGTVPYHAARIMVAERFGSTKPVVTASIAYEAVLQVGAAALLGVVAVAVGGGLGSSHSGLYVLALVPLAFLPLALHPRVLTPVANRLLAVARRQSLPSGSLLTGWQTARAFGGYAAAQTLGGLGFYLVIVAVTGISVNPVLAVGAYCLAGAAGVAVLFLPSGLGVREAVLVAVMSSALSPEQALLAAAIARAVSVVADLVPLAVVAVSETLSRVPQLSTR